MTKNLTLTSFSAAVVPTYSQHLSSSHPSGTFQPLLVLDMSFTYFQFFSVSLLSAIAYLFLQRKRRSQLPYPPGPKGGLPLIGDLRSLPDSENQLEWLAYEKLGKDLGDKMVHLIAALH